MFIREHLFISWFYVSHTMRLRYEPDIHSNFIQILFEIMFSIKMWRIAVVKLYFTVIEKKVQHYDWDLHQ